MNAIQDSVQDSIQNFYYLLYISNPTRERVRVYPDGDEASLYLSFEHFKQLILATGDMSVLPDINMSLATYGTPWLYIREKNRVVKVVADKEKVSSIISLISTTIADLDRQGDNILNPATNLSKAELVPYELNDPLSPQQSNREGKKILPSVRFHK